MVNPDLILCIILLLFSFIGLLLIIIGFFTKIYVFIVHTRSNTHKYTNDQTSLSVSNLSPSIKLIILGVILLFDLPIAISPLIVQMLFPKNHMEIIINKYDKENFSSLIGWYFHARCSGLYNFNTYMIGKKGMSCGSYAIDVSHEDDEILEIRKGDCNNNDLTISEIRTSTKIFLKFGFKSLSVDSLGNDYIGLICDEPPNILRVPKDTSATEINGFLHYRGRWYVRN